MSFPMGSPGASSNTGTGPSGQRATSGMDSSVVDGLPVDGSAVDGSTVDGSTVDGLPVDGSAVHASVQDGRAGAAEAGPELPATDDQAVDEAVEALLGVLQRPLGEQVEVYADVHGRLQDRLADLDG